MIFALNLEIFSVAYIHWPWELSSSDCKKVLDFFIRLFCSDLACSAGVFFFKRAICSRKRHVETSRREEEMGRPRTYRKGYYFYSPQTSTVIKSKMAATTILRTRTRFRPPNISLHCRLVATFSRRSVQNVRQTKKHGMIFCILFFLFSWPTS